MRDFQRSRVYNWEWDTLRHVPVNKRLSTVRDCQILVDKIWLTEKQHPNDTPIVTDGRGRTSAASFGGWIAIPRVMRQSVVICHEVAHEMLPRDVKHTEDFVSTFINVLHNHLELSKDALIETAMDFKIKMNHNLL